MTTRQELQKFTSEQLREFLEEQEGLCDQTVESFVTNRIDGEAFLELSESDLRELVIPLGDRKKIQKILSSYTPKLIPSLQLPTCSSRDPSWVEGVIPPVFSRATIECMEKKTITKSVRSEVGEMLSHRVYAVTEYPTSEEYTAICRPLITKYPILADSCGNGYGSWKEILRQRMSPAKKRDMREERVGSMITGEDNPVEYEENLTLLRQEQEKEKPSKKTTRQLMKATHQGRRQWILSESPTVADVLQKFPLMKTIRYLVGELQMITNIKDWDHTEEKLGYFTPRICALAWEEGTQSPKVKRLLDGHVAELEAVDDGYKSLLEIVHLVEIMSVLLVPRSKSSLLKRFTMDQNLDDAVMSLSENHPYLAMVIGGSSVQLFLVAERCVLEAINETMIFAGTIAAYYAFNMAYPKPILAVLLFIQHFLLVIKDKQPAPVALTKFLSSLDKIDI